jgi:hypothetical protein
MLPWGARSRWHAENPPGRVFHDDKHTQEAEAGGDHHTEITVHYCLGMMTDKGPPALGRNAFSSTVLQALRHAFAYGPKRHAQAKFQQKLVRHVLLAPGQVIAGHETNECLQLRSDRRSSRMRCPPPEWAKLLAVPASQRRRL